MPTGGKCVFNHTWTTQDEFKSWLSEVPSSKHEAYCKLCRKKFNIASMGKAALKSHMNGVSHKKYLETTPQIKIRSFLVKDTPGVEDNQVEKTEEIVSGSSATNLGCSLHNLSTLNKQATDAELLWVLHCVSTNSSAHSNVGMNDLFKAMFCDSKIASTYSLSETKYRYLTTFGLGPYFFKQLLDEVKISPAHSILFDESLNQQLQSKQLDVHVRYWSEDSSCVESRYYNSVFIGHGTANDLIEHYTAVTKDLDAKKTWQIGMDGPNVNIAFHRKIQDQRKHLSMQSLLDIGTCGLHTVHRAFQTGADKTDWNFDQFLKKEYKLFKDSPARREDFIEYTGTSVFPMKFCNHRYYFCIYLSQAFLFAFKSIYFEFQMARKWRCCQPFTFRSTTYRRILQRSVSQKFRAKKP